MKFSELPVSCCFVVLKPDGSAQLMIKTSEGKICDYMDRSPANLEPSPDAQVQQIHVKPKNV